MEIEYQTIIIGAGFAGLYYINKFRPENYLLLERSERVGGRVYNMKWYDEQISLGGGVIRPSNINLLRLVDEYELETSEFISKYELIDLPGETPNESDYYESNMIIIKYLKNLYKKNREEITRLKLNFDEFMLKYLDFMSYRSIKNNLLYISYLNADPGYVLSDEVIKQLMRVEDTKLKYIKPNGYNSLMDKLLVNIDPSKIRLNTDVLKIEQEQGTNNYKIICSDNKILKTKKIVLATEKNPQIEIKIDKVNQIYKMVGSSKYIRVYGYWKSGHKLKSSIRSQNILGKMIIMSDNILMAAYTEFYMAEKLYNLLEKNNKPSQIEIIYDLMKNSGLEVEKPDDIIYKFWEVGTHYPEPNTNFDQMRIMIKEVSKNYSIDMVGEVFSSYHGWVDCAIESVDLLYNDLYNKN